MTVISGAAAVLCAISLGAAPQAPHHDQSADVTFLQPFGVSVRRVGLALEQLGEPLAAQERKELEAALGLIFQEGLGAVWARHARLAGAVHAAVEGWREGGAVDFFAQDPASRGFEKSFASLPAGNNHFGLMASPGAGNKAMRYTYTENGKLVETLPKDYYSSNYFTDRLLGFPDACDPESATALEYDSDDHRELGNHTADNCREELLEDHGAVVCRVTRLDMSGSLQQLITRMKRARARGLAGGPEAGPLDTRAVPGWRDPR